MVIKQLWIRRGVCKIHGQKRSESNVLVRKLEGNGLLEGRQRKEVDNIKVDAGKIYCEVLVGFSWIGIRHKGRFL
jgi:hypothetical protein